MFPASSSPKSVAADDVSDCENTVITDADIEELEKLVPPKKKQIISDYELRVKKVAQEMLQKSSGIISTTCLMEDFQIDAANFLVDQCLFLSTDDLFQDRDYVDPEGYIKYVPDDVDFLFISRLISYNIHPAFYFKNIDLPDVWRARLSTNGIRTLRTMKFYRNLLDSSPPKSSSDVQFNDDDNNKQTQNSLSISNDELWDPESENLVSDVIEKHQQVRSICSKTPYHRADVFSEHHAQMEWTMLNVPGYGLNNKDIKGNCKNICYINAVVQCLANTAPFVQWLLTNCYPDKCDLTADDQFCSLCVLYSIIRSIHRNINNEYGLSSILSYTSAEPLAQQINQISSAFSIGAQEDPCEFLIFLLDHLNKCVTSTESSMNTNPSITSIQRMFGLSTQFVSTCHVCLYESTKENWDSVLSVPIFSHSTLIEALSAYCSTEELDDDNLYVCAKCKKKVPSSRKIQIVQTSPIIFIQLRRFIYDKLLKTTRKINEFIIYPERLDLTPYLNKNIQESNKENNQFDNFTYRLYAVVVHLGTTAVEGHIFAYIRSPDGLWYKANDESVKQVKSDKVFAEKDAYILCYTKVPRNTTISTNTELRIPPIQSTSLFTSSTPIHPNKRFHDFTNNYTNTSLSKIFYMSPNDHLKQNSTNNNLFSNEYSSILNNDTFSDHSSPQECLSPVEIQYFTELNSFQTESRIEILPNDNFQTESRIETLPNDNFQTESRIEILPNDNFQKNSNRKSCSSINTQQISNFDKFISSGETSSSSTSQNKQSLSSTSQNEQFLSSHSKNIPSNISSSIQLNATVEEPPIGDDFITELPSSHQFKLRSVDLVKLLEIRSRKIKKKKSRLFEKMGLSNASDKTTPKTIFLSKQNEITNNTINKTLSGEDSSINIPSQEIKQSNVDVEYLYILLPYIKQFNGYCGLCVRICIFGTTSAPHRQLLRCNLHCIGRPICTFKCSVIVQNNGVGYIVVTNRTVRHARGVKICRPTRAPLRTALKKQLLEGRSVFRIHQEKLQKRSLQEKKGQNYDGIGRSRNILRKIKSEGITESFLAPDVDEALTKLLEKFKGDINSQGKVTGVIQIISKYPFQIILYSETSIRLFDQLLKHKNVIVSWDATGSIIKETNNRRFLYYELSITLPGVVNDDSIVPITFMLSTSHALVNIVYWLESFKHSYSQIFINKQFPRPRIVLSDRAQVFLIASLKVWNNETMEDFYNRAYRIVTGDSTDSDHDKTNIHACLSHVLLDARKTINKNIPEQFRNLAMWCMALLINTSTWNEFTHNWELICFVFLQLHLGGEHINKQYQDALMDKISKIQNDPNTSDAIKATETLQDDDSNDMFSSNIYDYYDSEEEIDEELPELVSTSKRRKIVIDEEKEANSMNSHFKSIFNKIFYNVLDGCGISIKEFQSTTTRGILKWFKYLTFSFMPTAVIWSNLLLGDLSRHRRRMVRSFEKLTIHREEQRTTAISERRMGILKRTQLGGEIHMRIDVLLSILIPDMLSMIDEFWNGLLNYCTTSTDYSSGTSTLTFDEQRLKPIEERWRQRVSKRGSGHYAKGPDEPAFTDLLSTLLASQDEINKNIKLPAINPNWLNVAIGMLLSLGSDDILSRRLTSISTDKFPILSIISTFLEEWFNSRTNNTKSTNINFSLSDNELSPHEQSTYILEKIFIPLLPCDLIIHKVYTCKGCQSAVTIRCTITSIPVSVSRSGLHLERDLSDFFGPVTSDMLCSSCNKATTRHIEVIQWPQFLLINVNDSVQIVRHRKPPGALSLARFSSWQAVGCPSANVYHLICFNSVTQHGGSETMVRVTKMKKSWITNIHKRVLGHGVQLQTLYAHSRIIILERIRYQNKFNIIHAISQCALNKFLILPDDISPCITLKEACSIIENHHALHELNNALTANIITYYYCHSCNGIPESLRIQTTQIFMFKLTPKNEIVAHRITSKVINENSVNEYCTCCNYSSKDVEMNVCKQIFVTYPSCLIQYVYEKIHVKELFESKITLTDDKNICHSYKPSAILVISLYSDTVTVIKRESNTENYLQINDSIYSEPKPLSMSKIADLFDTAGFILAFYHKIDSVNPSQMRIVSHTNDNGVQRIVIQQGDRFFSITPASSSTTNK